MRPSLSVVLAWLSLVVVPVPAAAQALRTCSTVSQNLTVREVMEDYYLWYQSIPDVDPVRFNSPEAYLDAIRYLPLDRSFSYITSREATDAYYNNSQFIGFGVSLRIEASDMRVQQVYADSPAAEAGLARGDRILAINGRSVERLVADNAVNDAWGPSVIGTEVSVEYDTRGGERRRAAMVKRLVTIPTVSLTRTFDVDGRRTGYFELRNFVEPSFDALDRAVASLLEAGVSELVIDLRYNGGGLVDVAVHLAGLVGGAAARGQVFGEMRHNDKHVADDETIRFPSEAQGFELRRLVIITTGASASASELLINGLRPFLPVIVVGDATYGKPVGQYGFNFCDKTLAAVAFSIVNARGEGDYFDGIPADCRAPDDIEHEMGDAEEASLAEALHVVRTGACSSAATLGTERQRAPIERGRPLTGWQALVNAY
jgi:carboxyl-terminal processing protease